MPTDPLALVAEIRSRLSKASFGDECNLVHLAFDATRLCDALEAVLNSYDPAYDWSTGWEDCDEYAAGYRHRDKQVRHVITDAIGGKQCHQ